MEMFPRKDNSNSKPGSSSGGGGLAQLQMQAIQAQNYRNFEIDMGGNEHETQGAGTGARRSSTVELGSPFLKNEKALDFEDLPDEMKFSVFSYLPTKDKLNSRLVCKQWDQRICSWGKFVDNLEFSLTSGSVKLLQESKMEWKHITANSNLTDFFTPFIPFDLKPEVESSIQTIHLANLTFTWFSAQELLNTFPQLKALTIENCKLEHEVAEGFLQTPEYCRKAMNLRSQLKVLHLKVIQLEELTFYIAVFRCVPMLKKLVIHHSYCSETPHSSKDKFLRALTNMIKSCEFKLASFNVTGTILFHRIIVQWLNDLRGSKIRLDLKELSLVSLSRTGEADALSVRSISALITFVKTQINLKLIEFPPIKKEYMLLYDQLATFGQNIKNVSLQSDWLLNEQFFNTFTNLEEFKVKLSGHDDDSDDEEIDEDDDFFEVNVNNPVINNKLMESVQNKIFVDMKKLWVTNCSAATLVSISISFPNVTNLTLDGSSAIKDEGLQEIIRNLINLESLTIGNSELLTDFGVTGILSDYCVSQFRTRKIYLKSLGFDKSMKIGHPLCSLKNLKVFKSGLIHKITDVGIYYGFNFYNLQEIKIGVGDKVTLWGVHQLGKKNKNLRKINLKTWGNLEKSFIVEEGKSALLSAVESISPKYVVVERGERSF